MTPAPTSSTASTSDTVEVKVRRNFVTTFFPGGPAKVGDVRKVPREMADSLIARGVAVLYDDAQKKLDEAAEQAARAAEVAKKTEEDAAVKAAKAHEDEKKRSARITARSGVKKIG